MTLNVEPNERGLVRVFALSMTEDEAKALQNSKDPKILGRDSIDATFVEIFPVSDLEQLGVAGYLATGCGIDPTQIEPDKAKLNQLDGWVMIVFSRAFNGAATTLKPAPQLTLIGTYAEPGVDWSDKTTLTSDAATTPAKSRKTPSDAAMSGRIAMIALLVIFALTFMLVWIAA